MSIDNAQVEVDAQSCSESSKNSEYEAQGAAAKSWLMLYGGQWKNLLANQTIANPTFSNDSNTKPNCEIKKVIDTLNKIYEKVRYIYHTLDNAIDFYYTEHMPYNNQDHENDDTDYPELWDDPDIPQYEELRDKTQILYDEVEKIHDELQFIQKPKPKFATKAILVALKDKENTIKQIESDLQGLKIEYNFEHHFIDDTTWSKIPSLKPKPQKKTIDPRTYGRPPTVLTTHTGRIRTLIKRRCGKGDIKWSPYQTDLTVILNTR